MWKPRWFWSACLVVLVGGSVETWAETPPAEFNDPEYEYKVIAPSGWQLYAASELPPDLKALFVRVGPDGQPTGASLSVRVYPEQVHSDLDFAEFVGLYQLNIRNLGLDSEQIQRHEIGSGVQQRISLEYSLVEEGDAVWYKQTFYRVGDDDVLLLSGKDLSEHKEQSVQDINDFFDSVRIKAPPEPASTPLELDLPTPKE